VERLSDWVYLVGSRLPPGWQKSEAVKEAGLDPLYWDFRAAKGDLSKFTEEQIAKLHAGIDKLSDLFNVPKPEQVQDYQAAYDLSREADLRALAAVNAAGWKFTQEQLEALEDQYWADRNAGKDPAVHPALKIKWDTEQKFLRGKPLAEQYLISPARKASQARYEAGQRIWGDYLPPGGNWARGLEVPPLVQSYWSDKAARDKMTPAQLSQVEAWLKANVPADYRNAAEWEQARALDKTYDAAVKERFPAEAIAWNSEYGALDTEARKEWRKAFPARYEVLKDMWDFKREYGNRNPVWAKYYGFPADSGGAAGGRLPTMGGVVRARRTYGGGGGGGGTYIPAPTAADEVAFNFTSAQFTALSGRIANFSAQVAQKFGSDMLSILQTFLALSPADRRNWRYRNYVLYSRLLIFLMWLLAQGQAF